jgi:hypothetical protein
LIDNQQTFGYTMICDLRDGNEFEFDVPYLSPDPWKSMYQTSGTLTMSVYEPLTANNNVPSTIPYMIEVKAGECFEFAIPRPVYFPLVDALDGGTTLTLQSGEEQPIGAGVVVKGNYQLDQLSQYTIGEAVHSIKTLIQIPGPIGNSDTTLTTTSSLPIVPWWISRDDQQKLGPSYATNFAKMYTFATGSTDGHLGVLTSGPDCSAYFRHNSANGNDNTTDFPYAYGYTSMLSYISRLTESFHFKLPSYQTYMMNAVGDTLLSSASFWGASPAASALTGNKITSIGFLFVEVPTGASVKVTTRVNAGDDARLVDYVGPSYLYIPPSPAS